ncbi:MAG: hypothetical protein WCK74_00410 [Gemmatimonadaceae bacterium]
MAIRWSCAPWGAALVLLLSIPVRAQQASPVGPAAQTDSLRRVRRIPFDALAESVTQQLSLSVLSRRYSVEGVPVSEVMAPFEWRYTAPHVAAMLTGAPIRFAVDPTVMRSWTPTRLEVDLVPWAGDTLILYGQTGSRPVNLDTLQGEAIGTVSTSVLDVGAMALGVPAHLGARLVVGRPVGAIYLGATAGVERDARPPATGLAWYQGTTLSGSLTAAIPIGRQRLAVSAYLSQSQTDSLGGLNQFPGGGTRGLTVSLSGETGTDSTIAYTIDAYYERPFGNTRNDQVTRALPLGTYSGWSASADLTAGRVTWTPTLSWAREASDATVRVRQGPQFVSTTLHSSATSWTADLVADIPLPYGLSLLPRLGYTTGGFVSRLDPVAGRVVVRPGRPAPATVGYTARTPLTGFWSGIGVQLNF